MLGLGVRRTAAWILAAAVLGGTVGCSVDSEKGKRRYLESGKRFLQKGKHAESIIQFRNAVKLDPKFTDAYYHLAQAHAASGQLREAFAALLQTVRLDPNRLEARLALGQIYLAARDPEKAREQAEFILKREANHTPALHLLGSILATQDPERAREVFTRLTQLQPNDPRHLTTLALLQLAARRPEEAEQSLRRAIAVEPRFPQAWIGLAGVHRLAGRLSEAEAVLQQGAGANPSDIGLQLNLADVLFARQRGDDARKSLAEFVSRERRAQAARQVGDFFFGRSLMDDSFRYYRQAVDLAPNDLDNRSALVNWYLAAGRVSEAEAGNREVLAQKPKDVTARVARARILLAKQQPDEAVMELRLQVKEAPESAAAHYFLGLACWQQGSTAQARSELQEALRLDDGMVPLRRSLAEFYRNAGDLELAIELAVKTVERHPSSFTDRMILGRLYLDRPDPARARNQFAAAQTLSPADPAPRFHLALASLSSGNAKAAERELDEILRQQPRFTPALRLLADLWSRRGDQPRALARIRQYVAAYPSDPQGHMILAALLSSRRDFDAAKASLKNALQAAPDQADALLQLGSVQQAEGDFAGALQTYQSALKLRPRLAALHTLAGTAAVQSGNRDQGLRLLQQGLNLDPGFAVAANNLAWAIAQDGSRLDEALALAQKAKELSPQLVNATDTIGWIHYKKGLSASAIPLFEECVSKSPQSPVYRFHLGVALLAGGDRARAKAELQTALRLKLAGDDLNQAQAALTRLN